MLFSVESYSGDNDNNNEGINNVKGEIQNMQRKEEIERKSMFRLALVVAYSISYKPMGRRVLNAGKTKAR